MAIQTFQDLRVWKEAHVLVLDIYRVTKKFPEDEKYSLVSQIRRSAASICSNIVEGYSKSRKEFIRYLDIARGSLEETKYHLILSRDLQYFVTGDFEKLYGHCENIGKMLHGLRAKLTIN